jgi:hypothetical protein
MAPIRYVSVFHFVVYFVVSIDPKVCMSCSWSLILVIKHHVRGVTLQETANEWKYES